MTDPRDSRDPGDPRDPRGLAADAPLLDAWLRFTAQAEAGTLTPMSVPGHKQRRDLTGTVTAGDAPLYGGLDSIKHADELLAEGERRAAQLWGADWCRFSVAGSTHGNQALALAAGEPGRPIVVTRALHRSLLLGIVLAGLEPVWVLPEVDPATGLPGPVPVRAVADALARHPDACAVFLGDPSYVGTTGDLAGHAAAAHEAGVPLLVERGVGRAPRLPPGAATARPGGGRGRHGDQRAQGPARVHPGGAGTGPHGRGLDPARLDRAFEATHTTSPTGTIMASIDAARALLARDGEELCGRLLRTVAAARDRLREVPGLDVLDGPGVEPGQAGRPAGRDRGARHRGGGRPHRGGHAGGDGRPRHDHPDRHPG